MKETNTIDLDVLSILHRFSDMEKRFARHTGRDYFPSLNFCLEYKDHPVESIKEVAEHMLAFVGLGMYTASVKIEKLNDAAGKIHLNNNMFVDITIDEGVYKNQDEVLGTLAHEICHEILHRNNLVFNHFLEMENEIYADLATFYVGLGELTMKSYQIEYDNKIKKAGYLTPKTYARAYVIMKYINGGNVFEPKGFPKHVIETINEVIKETNYEVLNDIQNEKLSKSYINVTAEISKINLIIENINSIIKKNEEELSVLEKSISDTFFPQNDPDGTIQKWQKFKIAEEYFTYFASKNSKREKISKTIESLSEALGLITEGSLVSINKENWYDKVTVNHKCPICKNSITQKLDERFYHFICPKCKNHIVINNEENKLSKLIEQKKEIRKHDRNEIVLLKEENINLKSHIQFLEEENRKLESQIQQSKKENQKHQSLLQKIFKKQK